MKPNYLTNSFSINMLADVNASVDIRVINPDVVPQDAISAIGHADTAAIVSGILGRDIPCNRASITLKYGDTLYVAQYIGPRLSEGTTKLPDNAKIDFLKIRIVANNPCITCYDNHGDFPCDAAGVCHSMPHR